MGVAPIAGSRPKNEIDGMHPHAMPCPQYGVLRRQLDLVDAGAKFFSDLFEHAPDAMVVVDQSELIRLRLQDLLPREIDLRPAARRLRDFGEASLEFSETGKDGWLIDMRLEARLFQADRYLVSFRDVTREKRFEREIERAHEDRTFSEAAASVVHDVNNLLVPIFCYADLLASRQPADEELQQSAREIRDAAERAASLARKLLSIANLAAETPAVVGMNEMLWQMEDMLGRLATSRLELSLRLDPALGNIAVDRERLERVVINLVLNARDAMPDGGKIVIETIAERSAKGHAVLCVSDTGVGMDASTRARIFEPFFTTKGRGGTGLGLAMVQSFVSRNHGFVEVDSQPGGGTTFRVGFPVVEESKSSS
jgi:two-component system cell cycle sensor histidine kinase/response regulator CckA